MDNEVHLDRVGLLQEQMHNLLNLSYSAQILQMKVAGYFGKLDPARVPETIEVFNQKLYMNFVKLFITKPVLF